MDVTGSALGIAFGRVETEMGGIGEVHMIPIAWHE